MSKIMNVYYGQDALPYKDKECQVHFPIIGQTFAGSSLVDTIKFYVGKIGGIADIEWLGIVKRADGSIAYQELESSSDSDGVFVTLPLASYYTEKKGDLYITLNGYRGGVEVTQDEQDIWHVVGTPIVQVAGAVKLTIAYAPVLPQNAGALETITVQEALGLVSSKLNKNSSYYLKVVSSINTINTSTYSSYLSSGDIVYSDYNKAFYKLSGDFGSFTASAIELYLGDLGIKYSLTLDGGAEIRVYDFNSLYSYANEQTLVEYIQSGLDLKANISDVYTQTQINTFLEAKADKANTPTISDMNSAIASAVSGVYKYKGSVSTYENLPTTDLTIGDVYNVEDTGDNYAWTGTTWDKLGGFVDLSDYATLTYVNGQLALKANATDLIGYVPTSRTIAGIGLSTDISSQALSDALVFATDSDIYNIMED